MYRRLLEAIDTGVNKALILFDDATNTFGKSSTVDNKTVNMLIANSIVDRCIKSGSMKILLYDQIVKDAYYQVKDIELLLDLCKLTIKNIGNTCDLNWIDTSQITDMSYLFAWNDFNGDISGWDVSNVTNMDTMFADSKFNGDISDWDVSNVTNMVNMFRGSKFNGDISSRDVHNATNMCEMFANSIFNHDLSNWDVSNVLYMENVFAICSIKEEYKPKFNY